MELTMGRSMCRSEGMRTYRVIWSPLPKIEAS